ncbi:hypothetical protein PRZ48_005114 [Zasmidium cellare]|uniref:Uncharacterized protein n=1 Tax=Zasmidium cellare TaxID=395010 RepID=A0ABR0ESM4_ZASCE|nr:hypothetical protein PRZ48_005114 [Zasmidium cellare]
MTSTGICSEELHQQVLSHHPSHRKSKQDNRKPANFFSLSAELRSRIYEEVLISDEIEIATRLKPPALPQTCCQIRHESAGIYWLRNTFYIRTVDMEASLYGAFHRFVHKYEDEEASVEVLTLHSGKHHWGNLMKWAKEIHAGRGRGVRYGVEHSNVHAVVAVVTAMVNAYADKPWEECEKALLTVQCMAGHLHKEWLLSTEEDWRRKEEEDRWDVAIDGFD